MRKRDRVIKDEFDLTLKGHKPFEPRGQRQHDYYRAMHNHATTVGLGPAGSGKTYVAASFAAEQIATGKKERLILTRPAVAIEGEEHGFLPGDLNKKMAPWTAPVIEVLEERIGRDRVRTMVNEGKIQVVPIAFMRGRTFNDAVVLLDEAQNTTVGQMKAILTRHGENTTYVIDGDLGQVDLKPGVISGLSHLVSMIKSQELPVPVIEFLERDIRRSEECRMWVGAYKRPTGPVRSLPGFITLENAA